MMRNIQFAALALAAVICPAVARAQEKPDANTLSAAQKQAIQQAIQAVETDTKAQTAEFAQKLESLSKSMNRNLLSDKTDDDLDRKLTAELAQAIGSLVTKAVQVKLRAGHEMVKILTPEQK